MKTVYLLESDMSKSVDNGIIDLFNARHIGLGQLEHGSTYQDMYDLKVSLSPKKGCGYFRKKDGADIWVLPFTEHEAMGNFTGVTVLTADELRSYDFDVEEEAWL